MSELTPTPTAVPSQPDPAGVTPPGQGSGEPAVQVPAGFVPQAELERAQAQAREWQARYDRIQAAVQSPAPASKPAEPAGGSGPTGFDPTAFSEELLTRVFGSVSLMNAVPTLRSEFPHADPSFYDPDVLKDFGSVEALRAAVEADHKRVQAAIDAAVAANGTPAGGQGGGTPSPLGPAGSGGQPVSGDPTPEQLAQLSPVELGKFMDANPGVVERVLGQNTGGLVRTRTAAVG